MASSWDLADWYSAGALGLSEDQLAKRVSARNAALKKGSKEMLLSAARVFSSVQPASEDVASSLVSALKGADTLFSRVSGEQDLRIFAASLIDGAPIGDSNAYAARLAVIAASFGGRRSFGKLDKLVEESQLKISAAADHARALLPARKPFLMPELDEAKLAEPAIAAAAIKALRGALVEAHTGLAHMERNAAVGESNAAERIELLLLLHTRELPDGKKIANLGPASAALRVGMELGRVLKLPASESATVRAAQALLNKKGETAVPWADLLDADETAPDPQGLNLPLLQMLAVSKEKRIEQLRTQCGIDASQGKLTLMQVLAQVAVEIQASRAWAA
jgi:hypothetical protein